MSKTILDYKRQVDAFFDGQDFDGRAGSAFEWVGCLFGCERYDLYDQVLCFSKGSLTVQRCWCGMVYNAHPPLQKTLDEFYENSKALQLWSQYKEGSFEAIRQREKYSLAIEWISNEGLKRILDIGAGNGVFLKLCKEAIPEGVFSGTEKNPVARSQANTHGINVVDASLDELNGSFDLVSFWGVLEHLKNPISALKKAASLGKRVLVCVPNVDSGVVRYLGEKAFTFCPQHLWYFNQKTLERVFRLAGLVPEGCYSIESEEIPIKKHLALLDPYRKDVPSWAWEHQRLELSLQGYKIIMYGSRSGERPT
mgnify:FL=1